MKSKENILALMGGSPTRTKPFTSWPIFGASDEKRVLGALRSGKWGRLQGTEVDAFERDFASMHGCRHGIAVVNGTVSLRIALMALGIRADDEVIVPPYTFLSTASAVVEANAIPVFADIDPDTFNLSPESVEQAITARTKAIIVVHFAGLPGAMDRLMKLAEERGIAVIEDAAHAHGASYRERPVGSLGHISSFSFQSSKNLTCGEGGIILTNDDKLAALCRSMHNCGRIPEGIWYEHHTISGNYRLGELQAALLNTQLRRLERQTKTRDANGQLLADLLLRVPGITPQKRDETCTRHSYHLFMLKVDSKRFGVCRTAVVQALKAEGIPCSAGYGYSLNRQPLFCNKAFGPYLPKSTSKLSYGKQRFPNSDRLCAGEAIWIEHSVLLGTGKDMRDISRAFEKVYDNRIALADWARGIEQ